MSRSCGFPARRLLVCFSAIAIVLACSRGHAAETVVPQSDRPISVPEFRRIFVPAEDPADWPTGGDRYLPIDEEEFAKLIQIATAGRTAVPGEFAPRIVSARYQAGMDDSGNLRGHAMLEIQHRGAGPALVKLSPWSLAISNARWQPPTADAEANSQTGTPAVIGNLRDGTLVVLVPASGNLALEWSLIGQRTLNGTLSFPFEVCASASNRLQLDAPAEVMPEFEQTLIAEVLQDQGRRRWAIDLGGRCGGELRLVAAAEGAHRHRLTLLHQNDSYRLSIRGLDCRSQIEIVAHGDSISSVELELDPGLELTAVQLGEQNLVWTVGPGKLSERRHVRIELPQAISDKSELLTLSAVAALPLGKLQSLPKLRYSNMFWQEGSITLASDPPLVLYRVESAGARRSIAAADDSTESAGRGIHLQCLSADDDIRIEVDYPQTRWSVNEGARVEFLNGEIVSRSVADFTVDGPDWRQLGCRVNPDWQIDSVEAELPESVSEWEVVETNANRSLLVRLDVGEDRPRAVRLTITGRKPFPLFESASVHDLTMLSFSHAASQTRCILLQSPDAFEMQTHGLDTARRIDPQNLLHDDPLYADPMPQGIAFVVDANAERMSVSLAPRRPQFSADIRIDATVDGDSVRESCEIVCLPSGTTLDRLLVYTSKSNGFPWQWSTDNALGKLAVRELSANERASAGAGGSGDAWELSWRLPQRERISIRGTRIAKLVEGFPIALVAAPEAATQTGRLSIAVDDAAEIRIDNRQLQAVVSEAAPRGAVQRIRGTFQYDPNRHGLLNDSAILIARPEKPTPGSKAWVSEMSLDTRLLSGAVAHNVADLRIQNLGQPFASLSMPAGTTVTRIDVNGAPIDAAAAEKEDGSFQIRFPKDVADVSVSIRFLTQQRLPRLIGQFHPAFPATDLRVLFRRWRLWLPVNYDAPTESLLANRYCARELSWSERLFGPLGRRRAAATRNPFSAEFWSQYRSSRDTASEAHRTAIQALRVIGATDSSGGNATWGMALSKRSASKSGSLLVSLTSLSDSGISAETLLPGSASADPLHRGIDYLRGSGLSLLIRGDRVLLGASPLVALNRRAIHRLEGLPAYHVETGQLASDLEQPGRLPGDFLTPNAWQLIAPAGLDGSHRSTDFSGWPADATMVELHGSNEQLMTILVQYQPGVFTTSSAAALFVFGLGIIHRYARSRFWPLLVAVGFSLALVVPIAWSPLAAAIFVGSACAWLLLAVQIKPASVGVPTVAAELPHLSIVRIGVAASSFLVVLIGVTAAAIAQKAVSPAELIPPDTAAAGLERSPRELVRVLVPIDKAQRSIGRNVYLPEEFYADLVSAAEKVRQTPRGWMISEARYRAAVTGDLLQREERKLEIQARLIVHTFETDAVVSVPLGGESASIVDGSVLVDGRLTEPARDPLKHPRFHIAQPGKHSIEMLLEAPIRVLGTQAGIDLTIPRVTDSQIELVGSDAQRVEVPDALSKSISAEGAAQRTLSIGNLDRLAIRWPDVVLADDAADQVQIEELYWIHVRPGSLTMDARLNIRTTEKTVSRLQLQVDPSMTLLEPQQEVRVTETHVTSGNRQLITLELPTPVVGDRSIELQFVVPEASGIGNLRLPECAVVGPHTPQRWMAISIDPALSFSRDAIESPPAMSVADFVRVWGPSPEEPQLAYRLTKDSLPVSLSTQPRSSSASAESTLQVEVGSTGTVFLWDAIVSSAESEFQWQVSVPPDLLVSDLTVTQNDGASVPVRWSRDRDDAVVNATADRPTRGEYHVTVRGRLPHGNQTRLHLPSIELANVSLSKQTLLIYRHRYVLATVAADPNWEASEMPAAAAFSNAGARLIGEWVAFRPAASAEILIEPNVVKGNATQVIAVNHVDETWSVEVDCHLSIRAGAVDILAFDVPANWASLQLEPDHAAAMLTVSSLPDRHFQRVLVRPRDLALHECHFRIVGKLLSESDVTVRMPKLLLEGMDVQNYVLLPKTIPRNGFHWELSQLAVAKFPATARSHAVSPGKFNVYRAVGDRPLASLREAGVGPDLPTLLYDEHQIHWTADGFYSCNSTFVLDRSSKPSMELLLPPATAVLHATVGGMPIAVDLLSSQRARLSLPVRGAPQWVEVMIAGRLAHFPQEGARVEITAPRMDRVKAAKTCWVVQNPSQFSLVENARQVEPQSILMARLAAVEPIHQAGKLTASGQSARAFESQVVDRIVNELDLLVADRRLPESSMASLVKSHSLTVPLQQEEAGGSRSRFGGWESEFTQPNSVVTITAGNGDALLAGVVRSPRSDLLPRILFALAALCLGAIGATRNAEGQRRRIPPIAAGIIAACVLWFTVEWLILPALVVVFTLLWILAPTSKHARPA